jgi:XTP/dITP diphosphohydrolase
VPQPKGPITVTVTSDEPTLLVMATRNAKKGAELLDLLAPPWEPNPRLGRLRVQTLADHPDLPDVVEDSDTFAGNARLKAIATARALRCWAIADDSGLTVDALNGAPGILSARYAGGHGNDLANNAKLLDALADVADDRRGAAFVCALVLADPTGTVLAEVQAACRGRITREPRGPNGFGYDPLFLIREYHKTFGELGPLVKHQLSHRARAFARLRPILDRLIASEVAPGAPDA